MESCSSKTGHRWFSTWNMIRTRYTVRLFFFAFPGLSVSRRLLGFPESAGHKRSQRKPIEQSKKGSRPRNQPLGSSSRVSKRIEELAAIRRHLSFISASSHSVVLSNSLSNDLIPWPGIRCLQGLVPAKLMRTAKPFPIDSMVVVLPSLLRAITHPL